MTDKIRLLAAIMFTDMVGYTALMQENEDNAKKNRTKYKQILEDGITDCQGKLLQYYGDGALVIFGSAITAVQCAVQVQNSLREAEIPVRIGLHIGDIVYDDEGVFGDAVNIASRIESLGIPGSVLVSEKLFDEIKNHPMLPARQIGNFELKNVKLPMNIYAITNEGLAVPKPEELQGKAKNAYRSVAVLPFMNMSPDPDNEFFSDGITEEIINALSKVEGLQVTSRTSSFAFKGKNDDIRQIGQKLNVSTLLEGSVRKAGERVRITAQLVNAIDGYHFWSETYDGKLENIFALQDEISRKIANKLTVHLAVGKITAPLVKSSAANITAYNYYLKGLFYWAKWNPIDIKKAIEEFEKALKIEPGYAKAYAWLANCYLVAGAMGFIKPQISYPMCKEYAEKAMQLDREIADSNIAIGLVYMFYDWNWEGARIAFSKALELNPGLGGAHQTYSMFLTAMGKNKEALEEMEIAARLDPLSMPIGSSLASCYLAAGRFDDSINQANKVLELDPSYRNALEIKGWAYYFKSEIDASISVFKEYRKLEGSEYKALTVLAFVYARCGCSDKTIEILKKFNEMALNKPNESFNLDFAIIYAGLKDYDKVFYYLEKCIDERSGVVLFLRSNQNWKELSDDPRFDALLKKVGLIN